MSAHKPSTRIGNAERTAAQDALQQHLDAGRLQVNEYAERFARAADATTAGELAALFTDLPAPRPKLPGTGSPVGAVLRRPVVVGGVVLAVVVVLGLVIALSGGEDTRQQDPLPTVPTSRALPTATPTPPLPTTSIGVAAPADTAAPSSSGVVPVRRETGSDVITLRPSFGVDLDNRSSPNWAVASGGTGSGRDVGAGASNENLYFIGDQAVVTGTPEYATCSAETGYTRGGIARENLQPGDNICLRTDEDRYALITVVEANEQALRFRAVTWEPVIPS